MRKTVYFTAICLFVCLSARPSVTLVICVKTAKRIVKCITPTSSPTILVASDNFIVTELGRSRHRRRTQVQVGHMKEFAIADLY